MDSQRYHEIVNPEDTEVSYKPQLDMRPCLLAVTNRPVVYILEAEEEEFRGSDYNFLKEKLNIFSEVW
jgi:hypothetical protein